MSLLGILVLIVYPFIGYRAACYVIFDPLFSWPHEFIIKFVIGFFGGWLLIPIALIKFIIVAAITRE